MEVLEDYEPDFIIAWGKRLGEFLKKLNNARIGGEVIDGRNVIYFKVFNNEIPLYYINHPAWRIGREKFHKNLENFMKLINR